MTPRESLVAAVADRPGDAATRLVFADWLDDHGEADRAAFVRAAHAAEKARPGSRRRADLLDRADDLLARHEADWLGDWRDRLVDWDFRLGFLDRVRLTATTFLRHGGEIFRREPVRRVELVDDDHQPLAADIVREVVAHPAFGSVRDCAVVAARFGQRTPLDAWLAALAANRHVRLTRFGPVGVFNHGPGDDGLDETAFAAFCRAGHLRRLRRLDLSFDRRGEHPSRPWLLYYLVRASFAGRLRALKLVGCGVGAAVVRGIATDPAFGGLRALELDGQPIDRSAWQALWTSATLTRVTRVVVGAERVADYARSAMARRVRDLTIRADGGVAEGWDDLIDAAPPPRRLVLEGCNPGPEAFATMRREGWLRELREMAIYNDAEYDDSQSYLARLFRPGVMPRLTALTLHQVPDVALFARLAAWRGLARLESLALTDEGFGRLYPRRFDPTHPPDHLRRLEGLVLSTEADAERFLALPRLERLAQLGVRFWTDLPNVNGPLLTARTAEALLRSERLVNVTQASLEFACPDGFTDHLTALLTDPEVLPRLHRLTLYDSRVRAPAALPALRARFGGRLIATY